MAKCGIYKITNLINNKCYIGQSVNIENRWQHHRSASRCETNECYNYPLQKAMRKYGLENFSFEILEECKVEELDQKEKYYIQFYQSLENGYNQVRVEQSGTKIISKEVKAIQYDLVHTDLSTDLIGQKYGVSGRTVRSINTGESWRDDNLNYPLRKKFTQNQPKKYCIDCGKEIGKDYTRCLDCEKIHRRKVAIEERRVSREELKQLIRVIPFTHIGAMYNVSDRAIRKWCVKYNLPQTKKEINSYSDEEWDKI